MYFFVSAYFMLHDLQITSTGVNSAKQLLDPTLFCLIALLDHFILGGLCKSVLVAFLLAGVIYHSVRFAV